jgi:hypothetical protein
MRSEPARGTAQIPSLPAPSRLLQGCLASVRASMHLQVVLPLEGLAAGLAGELTNT